MHVPQVSSTSARTVVAQLSIAMTVIMTADCLPSTKDTAFPSSPWVVPSDSSVLMACGAVAELVGSSRKLEFCPWWRQQDPTLFLQQLACPPCALVTNQYAITGSKQQAKTMDWRKDDPEEMAR